MVDDSNDRFLTQLIIYSRPPPDCEQTRNCAPYVQQVYLPIHNASKCVCTRGNFLPAFSLPAGRGSKHPVTRGSRVNPRVGRWTLFTSKKATFFTTVLRYCPWTHLNISVIPKPMTLETNISNNFCWYCQWQQLLLICFFNKMYRFQAKLELRI